MLGELGNFCGNIEPFLEHSWTEAAKINWLWLLGLISRLAHFKLPLKLGFGLSQYRSLSHGELSSIRPDVIFAYERYPSHAPVPVLWMTGPVPDHRFYDRLNQATLLEEIAWKRECGNRAAHIICSTTFGKNAFCRQTGLTPERVHVVPFLLPHLRGRGRPQRIENNGPRLRCLFVGREAIRKGIRRALEVFDKAPAWSFHIISNFADGHVDLPSRVTHQNSASQQEVLDWMARSDLLFSLSEFDSFGFAAVEAASRQCIPVFRAGSIQQTMFSSSAALFLDDSWTPEECAVAIQHKFSGDRQSTRNALLSEFRANFSPEAVAGMIYSLALNAIGCEN
jgi:glycosyltransferase involved in cell wall biosynthesis